MEKLSQIKLRKQLIKNDALQLIKWLQDEEITFFMNESKNVISQLYEILNNKQEVLLTYFLNQTCDFFMIDYNDQSVGFISLYRRNNCYEIVIAIGEKEHWGKQIARHCIQEILDYDNFKNVNFIAKVHHQNIRSQQLFEHLNFIQTDDSHHFYLYEYNIKF